MENFYMVWKTMNLQVMFLRSNFKLAFVGY